METSPIRLMRFERAVGFDPAVDGWFERQSPGLGNIAKTWFDVMRVCRDDICELLHDGHPTACIGDAAFGYVNAFASHVNVGFFLGAWLDDPNQILEGSGKRMRHVKLRPNRLPDSAALEALIRDAYAGMQRTLRSGAL